VIRAAVHDADTGFLMVLVIAVSSAIPAALPVFAAAFVALSVNSQNWQNASVSTEHKTCTRTNAPQWRCLAKFVRETVAKER